MFKIKEEYKFELQMPETMKLFGSKKNKKKKCKTKNGENLPTLEVVEVFFTAKKWSLAFRISSVNVNKSAVSCGFGYIYWRNY